MATATTDGEWPWAKPVVITFDDGYMDNYTWAYPILKRYGLTASIMLVTSNIGGTNEWDQDSETESSQLLGTAEIREMARNGITYGSHTLTHRALTELDDDEAWKEIVESKSALESLTGSEINTFCYPYGHFDQSSREAVEAAGFLGAVSVYGVGQASARDRFALPRIGIEPGESDFGFTVKTSGAYRFWRRLPRLGLLRRLVGGRS